MSGIIHNKSVIMMHHDATQDVCVTLSKSENDS
jgi:hypothetical protein